MIPSTIYAYPRIGRMRIFARKAALVLALPLLLAIPQAGALAQADDNPNVHIDLRALDSLGGRPVQEDRITLHPPRETPPSHATSLHPPKAEKQASKHKSAKETGKSAAKGKGKHPAAKTAKGKSGKTQSAKSRPGKTQTKTVTASRSKAPAAKTAKAAPVETTKPTPQASSKPVASPNPTPVTAPAPAEAPAPAPAVAANPTPAPKPVTAPSAPAARQPAAAPVAPPEEAPAVAAAPSTPIPGGMRVTFGAGISDLSDDAKRLLDRLAASLGKDDQKRIQLIAFAGGSTDEANQARRLSLSRALNVRAYLIDKGVRNTRMDVRALGNRPDSGGPADRVDIVLIDQ